MLNLLFADGGANRWHNHVCGCGSHYSACHTHRFGNALQKMSVGQNHGYIRLRLGENKGREKRSSLCMHGGARLVWPFFQNFSYMDLTPISISVDLKNALSKQNIRIDVPSIFTVGISTEPGIMQNAAERLRSLKLPAIQELAKDIIFGQLRLVIATMDIEEINTNRDKFLDAVSLNVESELKKVGLRLINVNVTDINDESGYIAALGKEAAAKAINDAKKSVAERTATAPSAKQWQSRKKESSWHRQTQSP